MNPPPLIARILEPARGVRPALHGGGVTASYGALRRDVLALRETLARGGIGAGDRVAICLPKTVAAVEIVLATLAAGAAYVPLNEHLPPRQLARLIADLRPHLLITTRPIAEALRRADISGSCGLRLAIVKDGSAALELGELPPRSADDAPLSPPDLAVILYTSGTTGEPKGIMLSHRNLESFVDWAAAAFAVAADDRLAAHAPLYFDLSIFDIFCGLSRHAGVHLIDQTTARFPGAVRNLVAAAGITIWYSVPTALVRLQERQALRGLASLRAILFAGEVFPMPVLRRLMADVPQAEYVNLYGPAETNVCTYHRLPGMPASDLDQLPIGRPCEHLAVRILDPDGAPAQPGEAGEICVAGPAVMLGYWGRPEATHASRLAGRPDSYRTGDEGCARDDGTVMFIGRRDQQVKVRGHRIELLALESVLSTHPLVRAAAALFVPEPRRGGSIAAFLVARERQADAAEIRSFVAERLPPHYQPDRVEWLADLPQTASGKCDRARLLASAVPEPGDPQ